MGNYTSISKCRISSSPDLVTVLSLGEQYLTGVFPKDRQQPITRGPLDLVWCPESGLVQLKQSYNPSEMYGDNYGYRSGLNQSMVKHLATKVKALEQVYQPKPGDVVLDIGSNDATTLKAYQTSGLKRLGIDPIGRKFKQYYPDDVELVTEFFSAKAYWQTQMEKAKIVTSIAMFYDLEDPTAFVREIAEILRDDGVWHFEQSYLPAMLRANSYDTICHEHVEYYSLGVVKKLLESNGLKILDVQMNAINGGSFAVTACLKNSSLPANDVVIDWLMTQEDHMGLTTERPYRQFREKVFEHREHLLNLLRSLNASGKKIFGYGASTKGNALLQFCGITEKEIPFMAEVNPEKFGCFTPGSLIPIVSEAEAKAMKPDYLLVLPWHFKSGIIAREEEFIAKGGRLIFPLPEIEIAGG